MLQERYGVASIRSSRAIEPPLGDERDGERNRSRASGCRQGTPLR